MEVERLHLVYKEIDTEFLESFGIAQIEIMSKIMSNSYVKIFAFKQSLFIYFFSCENMSGL